MPFPFVPAALTGGILFALLFKKKPVSTETQPVVPVTPIGPGPRPPPPPEPEPLPVVPTKVPGVASPENMFVVDAPGGLKVRPTPVGGPGAPFIAIAKNGSVVTVLEFDVNAPPPPADNDDSELFGWAKIRVSAGKEGFVARRFLSSSGASGTAEIKRQKKQQELSDKEGRLEQPIEREPRPTAPTTRQIDTPEGPVSIPVVVLTPDEQDVVDKLQNQGVSILTPEERGIFDALLNRGVSVNIAGVYPYGYGNPYNRAMWMWQSTHPRYRRHVRLRF